MMPMQCILSLRTFFNPQISRPLFLLYLNSIILGIGGGLLGIFLPIFLYEKFHYDLFPVLVFYILECILYTATVPFGGAVASFLGFRKSMIAAIPFHAMFYGSLMFFDQNPVFFLSLALAAATIMKIFYWTSFHAAFAQLGASLHRGKQLGFLSSLHEVCGVAMPFIGAVILTSFGYPALFGTVIFFILCSVVPLFFVQALKMNFTLQYTGSFRELFQPKNKRLLTAFAADGAETAIAMFIWPLFIFQLFEGRYIQVGAITSGALLFAVLLRFLIGDLSDILNKSHLIKITSVFYAFGWAIKTFVETTSQVLGAHMYHNFVSILRRIPFDTLYYERAAKHGHFASEYVVLREISLNASRGLMLLVVLVLIQFGPLNLSFWAAAFVSLFIGVL